MSQLKRIDEYVSKLFADSAIDETQMAIILIPEGGDGEGVELSKTNERCINGDFLSCSKENTTCTNYIGYCSGALHNGLCDNSLTKPTPTYNPCPLTRCQL